MKRIESTIHNQRGQGLVETVLLLAVIMMVSLAVTRFLEESQFASKLVSKPWGTLTGMIECGTWQGCAKGMHPNSAGRILSLEPDR